MADTPSSTGGVGSGGPVMFSGYVQIGVNAAPLKKGLEEAEQATKQATQSQAAFMAEVNRKWMASQRSQVDARKKAVDEIVSADLEMERSLRRMPGAASNASNAVSGAAGKASKLGRVFLEGSRGAEDFMIQLGPMGVGGALRGAGNNISQMMSLISPMAGAFAGIGVAIMAGLINPLTRALSTTDEMAESLERLAKAIKMAKEAGADAEEELELRRFVGKDEPDTKDIRRRMDDFRIRSAGLDAQEKSIREALARVQEKAGLTGKTEQEILLAQEGRFLGGPDEKVLAFVEGRRLAQEAFDEIAKEREKIGRQKSVLALGLPAAERREAEEGQKDVAKNIEARQKERLDEELKAMENEEKGRKEVLAKQKRSEAFERKVRREEAFDKDPRVTRAMKIEDDLRNQLDELDEMRRVGDIGAGGFLPKDHARRSELLRIAMGGGLTEAEALGTKPGFETPEAVAEQFGQGEELVKILKELRGIGTAEDQLRSAAEKQILGLEKEPKERRDKAEFTGIADLSKKIQLALSPDKATKAAEKTAKEVEEANKTLKQIAASVKNPPQQFGIVAPGGP